MFQKLKRKHFLQFNFKARFITFTVYITGIQPAIHPLIHFPHPSPLPMMIKKKYFTLLKQILINLCDKSIAPSCFAPFNFYFHQMFLFHASVKHHV